MTHPTRPNKGPAHAAFFGLAALIGASVFGSPSPAYAVPRGVPEAAQCARNQQHTCQPHELDRIPADEITACGREDYGVLCCDAAGWSCCGEDDICIEGDFWSSRPGRILRDSAITGSNAGANGRAERTAPARERLGDRAIDRARERDRRADRRRGEYRRAREHERDSRVERRIDRRADDYRRARNDDRVRARNRDRGSDRRPDDYRRARNEDRDDYRRPPIDD